MRLFNRSSRYALIALATIATLFSDRSAIDLAANARADDLQVDGQAGDDEANGVDSPVKTIAAAIRLAKPGDTIHLQPEAVYRDWAPFYDVAGEPDRPITLAGHGATLDGCDPLDPKGWIDLGEGLFRHDDLLPLTDAIVDRWFFVQAGVLNRMSRCSKGPSQPLKEPGSLSAGEWTFVKDAERSAAARPGYIHGSFFLRLAPGKSLADARIEIPYRPAGVLMHGACRHLIVRDLRSIRPYNDGFNLSDCQDISFENIHAIDCGDDGISAHGACRYRVDGLSSIGNATGICDTGDSETTYRRVVIERCVGFDLFFLDTGRYSLSDSIVRSSAARPLYLQGRDKPAEPCRLTLDNVLIDRVIEGGEIRVNANCLLTANRCEFRGLEVRVVEGNTLFTRCRIDGDADAETGVDVTRLPK